MTTAPAHDPSQRITLYSQDGAFDLLRRAAGYERAAVAHGGPSVARRIRRQRRSHRFVTQLAALRLHRDPV
jgi:hypothetical protein